MADPLSEVSDERLMVNYQRGDRGAFRELVARHHGRVYNFSFRLVRDGSAAEEVTQEVFFKVVKHAAEFKHESRFSTWLYTIARNLCIDHARRGRFRHHQAYDDQSPPGDPPGNWHAASDTDDVERAASSREVGEAIADAVAALPMEQREVFLLREVAGLPFREIASAIGTNENTAKSRMRYALERLQRTLSKFEEYARALR